VGLAWLWLLDPVVGPFNYYLKALGVPVRSWLADPHTAMWAIILTTVWWVTGYYLVIYLAGLQDIPRDVYEAEDGATGLDAFTHHVPDIVMTDWAMPIFDGLELTQMIRQPGANANPFVPIIMVTGHTEKERVTAARDAGVTEFLAKPISAKALYQRIVNVVANPRPFIKTKTYFGPDRRRNTNNAYIGPERRVGGEVEVLQQPSLLDKARSSI